MQAFSARNFQPGASGYDRHWYDTSRHLQSGSAPDQSRSWCQETINPTLSLGSRIELGMLQRFFSHPIRFFFNSRLGISMPAERDSDDEEKFSLKGLQKWELAKRLADDCLTGRQNDVEKFSALGLLPHGSAAIGEWSSIREEYQYLLDQLTRFRDEPSETRSVECELDQGLTLFGEVGACYPDIGLVHYSASKSIKSRATMSLWIDHLALSASGQLDRRECSQLLTPAAKGLRFEYLDTARAREILTNYVALFHQGLVYPLPVFPDTSYTWASHDDPEVAMSKALACWQGGRYRDAPPGECEDRFIRLALQQNPTRPLDDSLFQEFAQRIYLPAVEHGVHSA